MRSSTPRLALFSTEIEPFPRAVSLTDSDQALVGVATDGVDKGFDDSIERSASERHGNNWPGRQDLIKYVGSNVLALCQRYHLGHDRRDKLGRGQTIASRLACGDCDGAGTQASNLAMRLGEGVTALSGSGGWKGDGLGSFPKALHECPETRFSCPELDNLVATIRHC